MICTTGAQLDHTNSKLCDAILHEKMIEQANARTLIRIHDQDIHMHNDITIAINHFIYEEVNCGTVNWHNGYDHPQSRF